MDGNGQTNSNYQYHHNQGPLGPFSGALRHKAHASPYSAGIVHNEDHPEKESYVFVTGNYTLSFDALRAALAGKNAYILVLDTKGINVWCAAFGHTRDRSTGFQNKIHRA